jgi:hypothetical protein
MRYALLFAESPDEHARRHGPDAPAYWGAWNAYMAALREAGVMLGGQALAPPAAGTTLRLREGRREVQDGPFADSKEMLGGYVALELPDLDAALDWAARAPCAGAGCVEIRPLFQGEG